MTPGIRSTIALDQMKRDMEAIRATMAQVRQSAELARSRALLMDTWSDIPALQDEILGPLPGVDDEPPAPSVAAAAVLPAAVEVARAGTPSLFDDDGGR